MPLLVDATRWFVYMTGVSHIGKSVRYSYISLSGISLAWASRGDYIASNTLPQWTHTGTLLHTRYLYHFVCKCTSVSRFCTFNFTANLTLLWFTKNLTKAYSRLCNSYSSECDPDSDSDSPGVSEMVWFYTNSGHYPSRELSTSVRALIRSNFKSKEVQILNSPI
jgi:hypothetical protein